MRFLVLSDTHGDRTQMVRALDYLEARAVNCQKDAGGKRI